MIKLKNILNETWPIKFVDKLPLRPENPAKNAGRIEIPASNDPTEGIDPILMQIINSAKSILDKKNGKGISTFTFEYISELMDDIFAIEIPKLDTSSELYKHIKRSIIRHLAKEYDIRHNGEKLS